MVGIAYLVISPASFSAPTVELLFGFCRHTPLIPLEGGKGGTTSRDHKRYFIALSLSFHTPQPIHSFGHGYFYALFLFPYSKCLLHTIWIVLLSSRTHSTTIHIVTHEAKARNGHRGFTHNEDHRRCPTHQCCRPRDCQCCKPSPRDHTPPPLDPNPDEASASIGCLFQSPHWQPPASLAASSLGSAVPSTCSPAR